MRTNQLKRDLSPARLQSLKSEDKVIDSVYTNNLLDVKFYSALGELAVIMAVVFSFILAPSIYVGGFH